MRRDKLNLQAMKVSAFLVGILTALPLQAIANESDFIVKEVTVYHEPGRFGGWPANHGMWVWGDELLFGFGRGYYKNLGEERHNIDRDRPEEHMLARSVDGGLTWSIEQPLKKGHLVPRGEALHGTEIPGVKLPPITDCPGGIDFTHPDFAMTLRMDNIHGGQSRFNYSNDRGKNWRGPFKFPNLGTPGIAARTDYIVDGQQEATVFVTAGKSNGKEGRVLCARTTDGGKSFEFVGWVGEEIAGYEIMPSSIRLSPQHLICTTRVREPDYGPSWIDAYESVDNGKNWKHLSRPVPDTGEGNPPSIIQLQDGRLCLTYGYRAKPFSICAKLSSDNGKSWSEEIVLRTGGGGRDIGYPCTKQCANGNVVTVYYFWEEALGHERFIGATVWDPSKI